MLEEFVWYIIIILITQLDRCTGLIYGNSIAEIFINNQNWLLQELTVN